MISTYIYTAQAMEWGNYDTQIENRYSCMNLFWSQSFSNTNNNLKFNKIVAIKKHLKHSICNDS